MGDASAMQTRKVLSIACCVLLDCSSETVAQPPAAPVNWQSLEAKPVVDAGAEIVTAKERALPEAYAGAIASAGFLSALSSFAPPTAVMSDRSPT